MSGRQARERAVPGLRGAGVYPTDVVPAVRPGDHVRLIGGNVDEVREVEQLQPQPGIVTFDADDGDDVSLTANGTSRNNEAKKLEQEERWLLQARMLAPGADLPDGVVVTVDQSGNEAPLYQSKNARGQYDRESFLEAGHDGTNLVTSDDIFSSLTELYVFEDETPKFTFEETAGATPTVQNVRWVGFQYRLSPPRSGATYAEPVPIGRITG